MKQFLLSITAITAAVLAGLGAPRLLGQSAASRTATPQSLEAMEAAGVKMSFDVASVKPNKSDEPGHRYTNVPLFGDAAPPAGGLFSATNTPLSDYIMFAYDFGQAEMIKLLTQLPPWAHSSRFDIEARAQGSPTRDQLRLMMQSLLADRFKLAFHTEIKQGPIYALVLAKPGSSDRTSSRTPTMRIVHRKLMTLGTMFPVGPFGLPSWTCRRCRVASLSSCNQVRRVYSDLEAEESA